MENLDVSKSRLKGFDHLKIHNKIDEYLEMLKSEDKESAILAIGLLYDDGEVMNYLALLLESTDYRAFIYHINKILDQSSLIDIKILFLFRIEITLEKIRRGYNSFPYIFYESK